MAVCVNLGVSYVVNESSVYTLIAENASYPIASCGRILISYSEYSSLVNSANYSNANIPGLLNASTYLYTNLPSGNKTLSTTQYNSLVSLLANPPVSIPAGNKTLTQAEYDSIISLVNNPSSGGTTTLGGAFDLTPAQGAQVGGAILLVWAAAWVIRALTRTLSIDEKETSNA